MLVWSYQEIGDIDVMVFERLSKYNSCDNIESWICLIESTLECVTSKVRIHECVLEPKSANWGLDDSLFRWFLIEFMIKIAFCQIKDSKIFGIIEYWYNIIQNVVVVWLSDCIFFGFDGYKHMWTFFAVLALLWYIIIMTHSLLFLLLFVFFSIHNNKEWDSEACFFKDTKMPRLSILLVSSWKASCWWTGIGTRCCTLCRYSFVNVIWFIREYANGWVT